MYLVRVTICTFISIPRTNSIQIVRRHMFSVSFSTRWSRHAMVSLQRGWLLTSKLRLGTPKWSWSWNWMADSASLQRGWLLTSRQRLETPKWSWSWNCALPLCCWLHRFLVPAVCCWLTASLWVPRPCEVLRGAACRRRFSAVYRRAPLVFHSDPPMAPFCISGKHNDPSVGFSKPRAPTFKILKTTNNLDTSNLVVFDVAYFVCVQKNMFNGSRIAVGWWWALKHT